MYGIIVASSVATTVVLLPLKEKISTRNNLEQQYEEIINKLPKLRYMELYELIQEDDPNMWDRAYGFGGQVSRIRRGRLLRRLVQLRRKEGAIPKEQASLILGKLLAQSGYAMLSIACLPVRRLRDKAARRSIELHCDLVLRTNGICVNIPGPKCLQRLDELL